VAATEGQPPSLSHDPGDCRVVVYTGPHARTSAHLAVLRRRHDRLGVARCRTLLDFARALKSTPWHLVIVDCGPGNPRLADVLSIFRRGNAGAPLVVVSEATPQLAQATEGLEAWLTLAPDDFEGLARALASHCPAPPAAAVPAARASERELGGDLPVLDREALRERLQDVLATGAGSAVLVVVDVAPAAQPGWLAACGLAALETISAKPSALALFGPGRLAALLDPGPADPASGIELAQRLRARLLKPILAGQPAACSSAAVAVCPARSADVDARHWIERAERACREVATPSEHGYAVLSRVPVAVPSPRTLPGLVQEALAGDRMILLFQPIVSLRGDAREHYEALIRLPTVAAGEMLPRDFFAAAEAAGLMSAVDQWVMRTAVRRLARERARRPRTHFFVAISAASLRDERLMATLCDELAAAGARGAWLTLQLRARDVCLHAAAAARLVAGLRQIRCGVALDGYEDDVAARELVDALRFDFVKLACTLTQGVVTDQARLGAVREAVQWLDERDIRSVAIGVEDAHALAYLWTAGIGYAQGFFLHEPSAEIGYGDPA
jgi:EAL domain-containing protein (putative c-di-GMP-specific phosphodiesterase class I)